MKYILPFLVSIISLFCFSQEEAKEDLLANTKRNTVYAEIGGSGAIYSLNFDRILTKNKLFSTSFTIGGTCWTQNFTESSYTFSSILFGIPISYNLILGKKNHQFESGLGISEFYGTASNDYHYSADEEKLITTMLSLKFGYRYQKQTGGVFFRVTFTPLIQGWEYSSRKTIKDVIPSNINTVKTELNTTGFFPWGGISVGYTLKN